MAKFVKQQHKMAEEAMKRHIFEAVVTVTQKGNTTDFTMQQIANEAEIAIGTLYNYFESKNTLLIYVFRQLLVASQERCQAIASGPGTADQRLLRWATEFIKFGREYVIIFRLFDRSGLRSRMPEEERDRNTYQAIEQIKSILVEGVEEGIFHKMDAPLMAKIFFAGIIGSLAMQPILNELSAERLSRKLMRFLSP